MGGRGRWEDPRWRPPDRRCNDGGLSLKKKEAEKKADPKAAALPFYKRFTRKQTPLGLLIFSLILSVLAVVTWYVVYQLELLPAGVHASFHTLATTFLISQGMGTGGQVEHV